MNVKTLIRAVDNTYDTLRFEAFGNAREPVSLLTKQRLNTRQAEKLILAKKLKTLN